MASARPACETRTYIVHQRVPRCRSTHILHHPTVPPSPPLSTHTHTSHPHTPPTYPNTPTQPQAFQNLKTVHGVPSPTPLAPSPCAHAQAESRCAQLCAMLQARTLQTAASAALQLRGELLPAAVALAEEATEATEQAPCARRQHTAKKSTGRPRGRPRKVQQVQQAAADALPTAGTGSQPSTLGG